MIDEFFKVYLIEVNTNPCFEASCNLLNILIPQMIENAIRYQEFKNNLIKIVKKIEIIYLVFL
jgi:hypothetical protein